MEENNKRKTIALTVIGVAVLLVLVIGSTFAYFSITNNSGGGSQTAINGSTSDLSKYGVPIIEQGESDFHIKLMASDMATKKVGNKYWATSDPNENYSEEEMYNIISAIRINEGKVNDVVYSCASDITILASGTLVTEDVVNKNDGKIYLRHGSANIKDIGELKEEEIDLLEIINANKGENAEGYKTTLNFTLNGKDDYYLIATDIMIENRNADQTGLAGKQIQMTIKNENLVCSVENKPEVLEVKSIMKTNDEYDKISVEVETSKNLDIDKYYYSIDSETNYVEWDTNTYTFTSLESGTIHEIRVYVKDKTGNISEVKNQKLTTKKTIFEGTGLKLTQLAIANNSPLNGLNNTAEGGMYRYQGSCSNGEDCELVVDNYICFGTKSKEECLANTDQYMYRIIGIDSVSNELKLIKKEAINETAAWYYQYDADKYTEVPEINWLKSDIAQQLNGYTKSYDNTRNLTALFVDSENKYPYMNKTGYEGINWFNLISPHQWYYGDTFGFYLTASGMYEIETGQSNARWYVSGEEIRGKWTQMTEAEANKYKIGLIQIHDYYYSQKSDGNNCERNYSFECADAWMHLNNNDAEELDGITTIPPSTTEQIMTRNGAQHSSVNRYTSWVVNGNGVARDDVSFLDNNNAVRPVFYLNSNVEIKGEGTYANPYTIVNVGQ